MEVGAALTPHAGQHTPVARKLVHPGAVSTPESIIQAPVPKVSEILEAEALLAHRQSRSDWQQALPDQHTRRALKAYADWEQIPQRDYLSQVLGIDEYV